MSDYDEIFRLLNQQGWAISDTAIPAAWQQSLLAESQRLWEAGEFHPEGIGRSARDAQRPDVRGDTVYWVRPGSPQAQHPFFDWMAKLREALNTHYDMGLLSQEFHFARYAEGKGYKKHIDQHRGINHRKVSIVLYLNPQWDAQDGGELCLYSPYDPDQEIRRVLPLGARLAVFVSAAIPHAVLPCNKVRWSLTGWLRTDEIPAD